MATTTKGTKSSSTAKKKTARKKAGSSILKYLPESLEHIQIVQQVAGVLEDMKDRVGDVKHEAKKELKKLMKIYEGNYQVLEKKVHKATSDARQQAQISMIQLLQKWHEHKDKLPAPVAKEVEKLIVQVGTLAAKKSSRGTKKSAPKKRASTKTSNE